MFATFWNAERVSGFITVALALLPAITIVAARWIKRKQSKDRVESGLAILGGLLGAALFFATDRAADAKEAELRAEIANATGAARVEAKGGREEASKAREATEDTRVVCAKTGEKTDQVANRFDLLTPAKRAVLQSDDGCPAQPAWRFGGSQIRMITAPSLVEAKDRMAHLMKLLRHTPDSNWQAHVVPPVPSSTSLGHGKTQTVFVIALNDVEPGQTSEVCAWLKCKGVEPGARECDTRTMQAALGAAGTWPEPKARRR